MIQIRMTYMDVSNTIKYVNFQYLYEITIQNWLNRNIIFDNINMFHSIERSVYVYINK
jgi:hypothetical protein